MTNTDNPLMPILSAIRAEARREEFPIDAGVYQAQGLDVYEPILCAGSLTSRLCFFARDLGKDEVKARQPLYGAAGKLVRTGVYRAILGKDPQDNDALQEVLQHVFLTNTVPYKPVGNKAYAPKVRERFRPFLERLLLCHWQGSWIIPLGNEALEWFIGYDPQVAGLAKDADRFTKTLTIGLETKNESGEIRRRQMVLAPLPHPSPLNQKYYAAFPDMLQARLRQYLAAIPERT
jgi:uracil-DNA glycosylase